MQLSVSVTSNNLSPAILQALKRASNPQHALEAAGVFLSARATRAWDEPALRPAPWAAISQATIKNKEARRKKGEKLSDAILKANGALCHSIRITNLSATSVTIGTDRFYAKFHQLGTKHMPARPFFPFTPDGQLTAAVAPRVEKILSRSLALFP